MHQRLNLVYLQKNAEGGLERILTLNGTLELQLKFRERIVSKLPEGHTLELASDIPDVNRSAFERK